MVTKKEPEVEGSQTGQNNQNAQQTPEAVEIDGKKETKNLETDSDTD